MKTRNNPNGVVASPRGCARGTQLTSARARLNIAAISSKAVAGYRDAEIASGKSPNTVSFTVRKLSIPFNAARRQGLITVNPVEAVELPATAKGEDGGETTRGAFHRGASRGAFERGHCARAWQARL